MKPKTHRALKKLYSERTTATSTTPAAAAGASGSAALASASPLLAYCFGRLRRPDASTTRFLTGAAWGTPWAALLLARSGDDGSEGAAPTPGGAEAAEEHASRLMRGCDASSRDGRRSMATCAKPWLPNESVTIEEPNFNINFMI